LPSICGRIGATQENAVGFCPVVLACQGEPMVRRDSAGIRPLAAELHVVDNGEPGRMQVTDDVVVGLIGADDDQLW